MATTGRACPRLRATSPGARGGLEPRLKALSRSHIIPSVAPRPHKPTRWDGKRLYPRAGAKMPGLQGSSLKWWGPRDTPAMEHWHLGDTRTKKPTPPEWPRRDPRAGRKVASLPVCGAPCLSCSNGPLSSAACVCVGPRCRLSKTRSRAAPNASACGSSPHLGVPGLTRQGLPGQQPACFSRSTCPSSSVGSMCLSNK